MIIGQASLKALQPDQYFRYGAAWAGINSLKSGVKRKPLIFLRVKVMILAGSIDDVSEMQIKIFAVISHFFCG